MFASINTHSLITNCISYSRNCQNLLEIWIAALWVFERITYTQRCALANETSGMRMWRSVSGKVDVAKFVVYYSLAVIVASSSTMSPAAESAASFGIPGCHDVAAVLFLVVSEMFHRKWFGNTCLTCCQVDEDDGTSSSPAIPQPFKFTCFRAVSPILVAGDIY